MNLFNRLLVFAFICSLFGSCYHSTRENKYLGKLPSISAKYQKEIKFLQQQVKDASESEEAFKYSQKLRKKREEANSAIFDYFNTFQFPTLLFQNLEGNSFEALEIAVTDASLSKIYLEAKVRILDVKNENLKSFFCYIKLLDQHDKMIGNPMVLASKLGNTMSFQKGSIIILHGTYGNLEDLEDFGKIVFISQEEYKENR